MKKSFLIRLLKIFVKEGQLLGNQMCLSLHYMKEITKESNPLLKINQFIWQADQELNITREKIRAHCT